MPGVNVVPVSPGSFGEAMRIGEVLAESGFFADTPTAAKAIVKMLAGRELGFGPIASMTGVDIIQGQVAVKPKLLASAIQRSPHFRYRVVEHDEQHCAIEFYEDGELAGRSEFTMADATKAALAGKDSWRKYPRNMLWARAMSNGANWYCAAIFGGPVYTPEELGAEVDAEGEVVSAPETPPAARDAATPEAAPTPPPPPAPTLDDAIAQGAVEGLETPAEETPAEPPPEPSAPAQPAPAQTPAQIAEANGVPPARQRLILLTIGGLEDATDLDAAYRSLPEERLQEVLAELTKVARSAA
jgi:hypothetical protein